MGLKFCANLSFMFQEEACLLKRYALAGAAGFKAVECAWPYEYPVEEVVKVKNEANLKQILINTPVTKDGPGKLGLCAIPNAETEFIRGFENAVKYAEALDCSLIHIMSGVTSSPAQINMDTYINNLKSAVKILESKNMIGLIEPINNYSVPDYYMNCYDKAVTVLQKVNSDNLKLMADVFHLQQIKGNLSRSIKELIPYIGHIQIAQVPDRHEPNTSGEVDYRYLLKLLESLGYDRWIGLEYIPKASSTEGLCWIQDFGYRL